MSDSEQTEQIQFVERVALMYERNGIPRIAGRILGWLLICDPPAQTAAELAAALHVSKGSISTMTRLLLSLGLIEHTSVRGDRRDYFHIPPHLGHGRVSPAGGKRPGRPEGCASGQPRPAGGHARPVWIF
jgi:DNA-binding transcriptional regulator GbsR (MarR family)